MRSPKRGRFGVPGTPAGWAVRLSLVAAVPLLGLLAVITHHRAPPEPETEPLSATAPRPDPEAARTPPMRERSNQMAASRSARPEPRIVNLVVRGTITDVETYSETVGEFLESAGFDSAGDYRVRPDADTPIASGMDVVVQTVEVTAETETEVIPYETVERETGDRERGERVVVQEGREGQRDVTIERVLVDGVEESETVVDDQVTDPVDEVIEVGTAEPPPPPPPPEPEPEPEAQSSTGSSSSDDVWDRLARCESNGNWSAVNPSGPYYGGLQFHPDTWRRHGGQEFAENAHQATREQQITVGKRLQQAAGWGQWPHCSRELGLR